jgi:nucleoside-diphosphate-sugar epimerase
VGSRLVERLILGTDYSVTALVHRFSGPGLARLARLPVNLIQGDLLNQASLSKAAENCHIIVHLAYGSAGDEATKRHVTVSGTENILKVALKKKVRKVIYLSTAAVHGLNPKGSMIDESFPFEPSREVYRSSKIQAEKLVWHYHKEYGLPVVIFRPPIIYGPYGGYWTERIVQEIQAGAILVNDGNGAANLIYVDNLIDAILLAMEKDSGDGEAFIVVDDDGLTWKDVYEAYAGMMNSHPPIRHMSEEEIEEMRKGNEPNDLKSWVVKPFFLIPEIVRTSLRLPEMRSKMMEIPWLRLVKNRLPRHTLQEMKYGGDDNENESIEVNEPCRPYLPSNDLVELYSSQAQFSNAKIKRILGYRPRIPFAEALSLIESWLRYQRLIP